MVESDQLIQKLDKEVALISQRLYTLQNNHLAHLEAKVNVILKIVASVGVLVTGQVLALLFRFIG